MTPARAMELWQTRSPFGEVNATPDECAYVKSVWQRMDGGSCWMDALCIVSKGHAELDPLIGSAVFNKEDGSAIEQTPVFHGATEHSPSVKDIAKQHGRIVGTPATHPDYGSDRLLSMR